MPDSAGFSWCSKKTPKVSGNGWNSTGWAAKNDSSGH